LLEWAADPADDPTDEAVWWATMPALGRLSSVETLRADLANMDVREFKRAFLNLWPDESAEGWSVIGRDLWAASRL
jgi:hypothetical protein